MTAVRLSVGRTHRTAGAGIGAPAPFRLPSVHLSPTIPRGATLAAWTIEAFEKACTDVSLSLRLPNTARFLTAERITFLDLATIQRIERADRDPQGTLLYQVFRNAGVPVEYLDTTLIPMVSALEDVGVYWQPLAPAPVLYASQAYLETSFTATNDSDRLWSALQFGDNLIRVWLDMLPEPRPVPAQHRAQVRECFRDSFTAQFAAVKLRFPEALDTHLLRKGFQVLSGLLDSDEAIFSMQGARLFLRFAGRNVLVTEHELGRELQTGIVSILGEKVRVRLLELAHRAFLRRFRPVEGRERMIRTVQWRAMQVLREVDLGAVGMLCDAYAHSDVPLYYWAASSKRINPWSYPP